MVAMRRHYCDPSQKWVEGKERARERESEKDRGRARERENTKFLLVDLSTVNSLFILRFFIKNMKPLFCLKVVLGLSEFVDLR